MSAQRQRPIDFATEGLLLARRVGRNRGIRVYGCSKNTLLQNKAHLRALAGESPAAKSRASSLMLPSSSIRLSVSSELATAVSLSPAWRAQAWYFAASRCHDRGFFG